MSNPLRPLLVNLGAFAIVVGLLLIGMHAFPKAPTIAAAPTTSSTQVASVEGSEPLPEAPLLTASTSAVKKSPATSSVTTAENKNKPQQSQNTAVNKVARIQDPYPFQPGSFDDVNTLARGALVNILCMPRGGSLRPISGSGVIIDSRGVILTNAHVAQYVLLSESPQVNLACYVRTGAPAQAQWIPEVVYIPPIWVAQHVTDIHVDRPTGTGEYDYALLRIAQTLDGSPLPTSFPSVQFDARPAIAFQGDQVLVASYPAEFLGGLTAEYRLYPASSITSVQKLLTFSTGSVDLISLGGVIEAQGGSSGGAVMNAWGRLVGIVTATSEGTTTADRDLRAITLNYIDSDLKIRTGSDLASTLGGDIEKEAEGFTSHTAPSLLQLYIEQLQGY